MARVGVDARCRQDLLGSEPMSQSGISAGRAIAPDEARHLRAAGTSWFAPERGMVRGARESVRGVVSSRPS